jgi:hypothetical protein
MRGSGVEGERIEMDGGKKGRRDKGTKRGTKVN